MEWSHYSQALFAAFMDTTNNIIVQACPGAGKTTNIKHLWEIAPPGKRLVYLVFNKHNQVEAQGKMTDRAGSHVLTLNGLGHRVVQATFGDVTLHERKVLDIVRMHMVPRWKRQMIPYRVVREMEWSLAKCVHMAKSVALSDVLDMPTYNTMVSTYDLDDYPGMYEDVVRVLRLSDEMTGVIDYADQIRFPAIYQCTMPQYDVVLGDEWQDASPIQQLMVERLCATRYVFVGDKRQSIYGFRGAMADAMLYTKDRFSCVELPLSITYRCAQSIVKEAQGLYPRDIEAWHMSPMGVVRKVEGDGVMALPYDADTLVLCRMNRPLISLAYGLLERGVPCYVRGRDIGAGLITLVKKLGSRTVKELIQDVQQWEEVELVKARLKEDEHKVQSVSDKASSLGVFMGKCSLDDSVDQVVAAITSMFDQGRGVCLTTVHKAKGLEAQRAYMLEHGLHGLFTARAKQAWMAEQERNIQYVAVTRGKQELVYM